MPAPKTPARLLQQAIATGDPCCAAAVYGLAGSGQREQLAALMFGKRRDALMLARWEHTPAAVLEALSQENSRRCDAAIELRLDKNPATPALALSGLYADAGKAGNSNAALTLLIAQHPHTPASVLLSIAQLAIDMESLKAASRNPTADGQVLSTLLARMAGSDMQSVFERNVAAHPSAPAELLQQLYAGRDASLRAAVIAHTHCPQNLIDQAIGDSEVLVQRQLAAKPLAQEVLAGLAVSEDAAVRAAIAANPKSCAAAIAKLLKDEAPSVRRAVAARADLMPASIRCLMQDPDSWVRQWLGRNPVVSRPVLRQLAADAEADVRRAVARNPHCPVKLLELLANDGNAWVRAAVAYQDNTPARLLVALALDTDIDVLSGIAANAHTPQPLLQKLALAETDIRRGVILNRKATRSTLLPLLEDPYYLHRVLLAAHSKLQVQDRWQLCGDPDARVRFAAFSWFAGKLGNAGQVS